MLENWKIIAIISCFVFLASCASNKKSENSFQTINYVIEQTTLDGKNALKVTMTLKGSESGQTWIKLPSDWAGNSYLDDVFNLRANTKDMQIEASKEKHQKLLKHKASELVSVSYEIVQVVDILGKSYKNLVTPQYFHFIGHGVFASPDIPGDEKFNVIIVWKNFPKNYAIINSFGAQNTNQEFVTTTDKLTDAIFLGGDYRVGKADINGKPLYVAIRGRWPFSDQEYFDLAKTIVTYQRNFFKDNDFDYFLITATPNGEACCSTGGTGLTNSFATFIHDGTKLDAQLKFLLSHELFHTWNGRKIDRKEPEQLVYWFSEGFTDYYSRLLLLRADLISLKEFVSDYNEVLYEYAITPVINAPNGRILKDFWKDYEVEKLPYRRGNILARKWNALIKDNSSGKYSMDNVLIDLFKEAQSKNTVVSEESLGRLVQVYYPKGIAQDLRNYVEKGDTIIPGEHDLGPCVKRKSANIKKMDAGYTRRETYEKNVITGLKKDSNAYKAGLRNGYKLLGREMVYPPVKASKVHINDGKQDRWISFLPTSGKNYKMYYYELDEGMYNRDKKKCLQWFN